MSINQQEQNQRKCVFGELEGCLYCSKCRTLVRPLPWLEVKLILEVMRERQVQTQSHNLYYCPSCESVRPDDFFYYEDE